MKNILIQKSKNPLKTASRIAKIFNIAGLFSFIIVASLFFIIDTLNGLNGRAGELFLSIELWLGCISVAVFYSIGIYFSFVADSIYKDIKLDKSFDDIQE